jgi:hypothetical protein
MNNVYNETGVALVDQCGALTARFGDIRVAIYVSPYYGDKFVAAIKIGRVVTGTSCMAYTAYDIAHVERLGFVVCMNEDDGTFFLALPEWERENFSAEAICLMKKAQECAEYIKTRERVRASYKGTRLYKAFERAGIPRELWN